MERNHFEQANEKHIKPDHNLVLKGRKQLEITGVKHVESFDNEEFLLETVMGFLAVRGQQLKMENLSVDQGIVLINGRIIDIVYLDDHDGDKAKGFFSKLFK
ncbi:sporulation protein YabP [Pueribacillus theae]|uniref:Sporulation protein YabP n=1 Tax=Pueribacillus theae TaxID=2171751 RepID=A0A2U1K3Z0_9BACI|nr:sporulation protein YabP [Pueribacillus theae]PWA12132.1 sporulation protein YabP [Pueribacillus theae]